jgi:hypothetical protein
VQLSFRGDGERDEIRERERKDAPPRKRNTGIFSRSPAPRLGMKMSTLSSGAFLRQCLKSEVEPWWKTLRLASGS